MKNSILFFALILLSWSCQNNASTESGENELTEEEQQYMEQQALEKQVMEVHDAVMPKSSDLKRMERELKTYLGEDSQLDEETKSQVEEVANLLNKAHGEMMTWMADYGTLSSGFSKMDQKAILDALEGEKKKIDGVAASMLNSLEMGQELLETLKQK